MKIRLGDISSEGLSIAGHISLEALNARLQEGRGTDITFISAPDVNVTITGSASDANVTGRASAKYTQPCSRCAEDRTRVAEAKLKFTLKPKPTDGSVDSDDIGIIYFDGDRVDLEEAIQEALILTLSIYWSPDLDKSSKCLECKQSFAASEEKTESARTLGALILEAKKKSGVS